MNKNIYIVVVVIAAFLSSCSAFPTAAPTPDLELTVGAVAKVMVAQTLSAMPTKTDLPTQTNTPTSTVTPLPSATPTIDPQSLITPTTFLGTLSSGKTEGLAEGLLHIENNTGIPNIIVSLYGQTLKKEQWIYYAWPVERMLNVNIFWANYTYTVEVPGKTTFRGSFTQNNFDKTTFVVSLKGVKITGP